MKAGAHKKEVCFDDVLKLNAIGLTQEEVSDWLGVSPYTLAVRIKEAYGCGYSQFLKEVRIDRELPDDDLLDYLAGD